MREFYIYCLFFEIIKSDLFIFLFNNYIFLKGYKYGEDMV